MGSKAAEHKMSTKWPIGESYLIFLEKTLIGFCADIEHYAGSQQDRPCVHRPVELSFLNQLCHAAGCGYCCIFSFFQKRKAMKWRWCPDSTDIHWSHPLSDIHVFLVILSSFFLCHTAKDRSLLERKHHHVRLHLRRHLRGKNKLIPLQTKMDRTISGSTETTQLRQIEQTCQIQGGELRGS
jgi:hypothetical protein